MYVYIRCLHGRKVSIGPGRDMFNKWKARISGFQLRCENPRAVEASYMYGYVQRYGVSVF